MQLFESAALIHKDMWIIITIIIQLF